jgi:hypothetical protein
VLKTSTRNTFALPWKEFTEQHMRHYFERQIKMFCAAALLSTCSHSPCECTPIMTISAWNTAYQYSLSIQVPKNMVQRKSYHL